jgi:hypothetical protein
MEEKKMVKEKNEEKTKEGGKKGGIFLKSKRKVGQWAKKKKNPTSRFGLV